MRLKKNLALSESGFLFNPSTGDSYSVNPIGMEIINKLKEGLSMDDIKSEIINDYAIDEGTIERDLYDFEVMMKQFKLTENEQ